MTGNRTPSRPKRLRVACIQINAGDRIKDNFSRAIRFVQTALQQKARFIALPENFLWRGSSRQMAEAADETEECIPAFKKMAAETGAAILLGSILEPSSLKSKFYNTSLLINSAGKIAAQYRKIHLFDIGLKEVQTNESHHIQRGRRSVIGKVFNIPIGLSVCYDLRFPELFRELSEKNAFVLTVPANFTEHTGKAHWEVLLRARAIENQCFVVAPGQVGKHPSLKIKSFGTSLIIDPWGRVLSRGSRNREEVLIADLEFAKLFELRKQFPVLLHRQI